MITFKAVLAFTLTLAVILLGNSTYLALSSSAFAQASSRFFDEFNKSEITLFMMEKNAIDWNTQPCYHFLVHVGPGQTYCDGSTLKPNDGGVSATKLCNMAGYQTATISGTGNWKSCHDNTMIKWNGNSWVTENACTGGNLFTRGVLCTNPIATPTPTVTPTATPTATPTPTPTPDKGLTVKKTDDHTLIRPGHTLTYTLTVKNTGQTDIQDLKVTDEVPSGVTILSLSQGGVISGRTITWSNLRLNAGDTLILKINVKVNENIANNVTLLNEVVVRSDDHDLTARAEDGDTRVERLPQIAGTVVPTPVVVTGAPVRVSTGVPITVPTGAAPIGLLTALLGSGSLTLVLRKLW